MVAIKVEVMIAMIDGIMMTMVGGVEAEEMMEAAMTVEMTIFRHLDVETRMKEVSHYWKIGL